MNAKFNADNEQQNIIEISKNVEEFEKKRPIAKQAQQGAVLLY